MCKDHKILHGDPHKLVEGCLIAGRSMNTTTGVSPATATAATALMQCTCSVHLHLQRVL